MLKKNDVFALTSVAYSIMFFNMDIGNPQTQRIKKRGAK